MEKPLLHILSGDLWAGSEVQMFHQIRALRNCGWDISVLLFNEGESASRYRAGGIPCQVICESAGIYALLVNSLKYARQLAPAIVVTHGYKENLLGFIIAKALGIPLVSTMHGRYEQHQGIARLRMALYSTLDSLICRYLSAKLVIVSRSLAADLGFDDLAHVEIVHNTVPLCSDGLRSPGDMSAGADPFSLSRPALVWAGRLVRVKRCDVALSAFAELKHRMPHPAPHLYIAGIGPEQKELASFAKELGIAENVHFLGFVADAGLLISKANLLLLSSDEEGLPTVLLEALAAGIPVVSTDVGGISEALSHLPRPPVILVPRQDSTAMAKAVEQILSEPDAFAPDPALNPVMAQHFAPQAAANRHTAIYKELLNSRAVSL